MKIADLGRKSFTLSRGSGSFHSSSSVGRPVRMLPPYRAIRTDHAIYFTYLSYRDTGALIGVDHFFGRLFVARKVRRGVDVIMQTFQRHEFSGSFGNPTFAAGPFVPGTLALAAIKFAHSQLVWNFRDNLLLRPMAEFTKRNAKV